MIDPDVVCGRGHTGELRPHWNGHSWTRRCLACKRDRERDNRAANRSTYNAMQAARMRVRRARARKENREWEATG